MPNDTTFAKTPDGSRFWLGECIRWLLLIGVGFWLFHPFMNGRQIGTGDAVWYHNMLADFVIQWRAGIFPVFVGQTDYAFNGAVYPLRVAPLYQHLAGVIDLLTGRHWSFYALQHATVVVCGFAGLGVSYFTLARLAPTHRWTACGLAVLYVTCPGVLGTVCTQDLYMTWMTVPFLPIVTYFVVRSFEKDTLGAPIGLGAGLAPLWLGHAPVALWMTAIVAVTQVSRLLFVNRTGTAWLRAGAGGLAFVALAGYVFVSIASLKVPGVESVVSSGLAESQRITDAIHQVFPAILLPVSDHARQLSDLQLGYAWWLVMAAGVVVASRPGAGWLLRLLVAASAGMLFLLLPVGGISDWIWLHLPGAVLRITYYWPMHRFYVILSALLAAVGQLSLASLPPAPFSPPRAPRPLPPPPFSLLASACSLLLLLACVWSLWESRQFVAAVQERTASAEITARSERPENRLLMLHSYGFLPDIPSYFSNGVMDYRAESRLLDPQTQQPLKSDEPSASAWQLLHGQVDANPGIVRLDPPLRLEPGKRYELFFRFRDGLDYTGILQLSGPTFFREYQLPESGQPLAFGAKPGNSHSIPLWTTSNAPESVKLRFIPTAPGAKPADYLDFGDVALREIKDPPVTVTSLMPYRATIRTPRSAWLETSRVFVPGYVGVVDGRPSVVRRSAAGMATLPLEPNAHNVELHYEAPMPVRITYWFAILCWWALAFAAAWLLRGRTRTSGPSSLLPKA
jgi:hypothetical protein